MKKSLIVVLSLFFVLGLAVPVVVHAADETPAVAKGDTKITLGGKIRIRGDFRTNMDFNEDLGDNNSTYETGIWLKLNVKVSPNTEGMVEFRDTKTSGDDDSTWGSTGGDAKGLYTRGGNVSGFTDARYTQFTQAWIQHKGSGLLGIPAGIKIGHMPMKLGNGLFYDHTKSGEDGFILSADPTKELGLALMYAKLYEGTATSNDDFNLYSLVFNYKPAKDINLSADLSYLDDQKGTVNSAGTVSTAPTVTSNKGVHIWNLGLRGNANVSGFGIKADVEIQGGKSKGLADYDPVTAGSQAGDVKFKGYAVLIGADYKLDPVTLGLEYAYGSGDSNSTDNRYKGFVNILDNKPKTTFIYEYRVVQPVANGTTGSQMGLNNTQYIKVSAAGTLAKDLKGRLSIYRLRANKVEGFTYNDKEIGWEIDPYIEYQIDKNLKYFIEGGYLFAGDFYKNVSTVPSGQDPDNAYEIRHGLLLTF